MNKTQKNRLGNFCVIMVIIMSAFYIAFTLMRAGDWFAWLLAILNLIAGPACLIFYLREVKRGIFKDVDEELELENKNLESNNENNKPED